MKQEFDKLSNHSSPNVVRENDQAFKSPMSEELKTSENEQENNLQFQLSTQESKRALPKTNQVMAISAGPENGRR